MSSSAIFPMLQGAIKPFELCIELIFPIRGQLLPADHGYGLYASLVHLLPELRQQSELSILTIPGIPDRQGKIFLTERSRLRIRVQIPKIPLIYQLAGKKIKIGIHEIQIGIPTVSVLQPSSTLRSRIVTIKGYEEASSLSSAAQRQLNALGIVGELSIPLNQDGEPSRKTIKIKSHTIVGFTIEVTGLSDEDSLKLQHYGLGGRRHFGCGLFVPRRRDK